MINPNYAIMYFSSVENHRALLETIRASVITGESLLITVNDPPSAQREEMLDKIKHGIDTITPLELPDLQAAATCQIFEPPKNYITGKKLPRKKRK